MLLEEWCSGPRNSHLGAMSGKRAFYIRPSVAFHSLSSVSLLSTSSGFNTEPDDWSPEMGGAADGGMVFGAKERITDWNE